jgi:6-pyruvoyltetrahydropterin/6-carboxytetrahydropterin synthase
MYRLKVEAHFDAAHKLENYKGKCSQLHGHRWVVEAFVVGEELDQTGLLVDFSVIKKKLEKIVAKLDHSYLNDIKEIGNPTAENLSTYIFRKFNELPASVKLEKIRVWENPESYSEYLPAGED